MEALCVAQQKIQGNYRRALFYLSFLPLNFIKHSSQINVRVPYRLSLPPYIVFCISNTCRLKSIKIDNHKKLCNWLLSISDICRLISIEFDRQRSTFIVFRNYRHVTSCCPAQFWQPTSSNSFPMCILFDQGEVPEIPMAEFTTQERLNDHRGNLPINLRTKIIEDFVEEEGDFVTGNIFY